LRWSVSVPAFALVVVWPNPSLFVQCTVSPNATLTSLALNAKFWMLTFVVAASAEPVMSRATTIVDTATRDPRARRSM